MVNYGSPSLLNKSSLKNIQITDTEILNKKCAIKITIYTGWVIKNYTLLYTLECKGFCEAQPTSNIDYNYVFSFT